MLIRRFVLIFGVISLFYYEVGSFSAKISMIGAPLLEFSATTIPGMETLLAKEVEQLKDVDRISIESNRVNFLGTERTGFEALLWLRTSLKLFEKLADSQKDYTIRDPDDLYDFISGLDWTRMIDPQKHTIKCDFMLGQNIPQALTHSHFSALTMKNAIVDKFRSKLNIRPSVDTENPTLVVYGYMHKGRTWLYRVWSGEHSMHKRGYRRDSAIHKAALRETTAAGVILSSGWSPEKKVEVLVDPMCGSGTLPIEAALLMANTAPGLLRYSRDKKPCAAQWLDIDQQSWIHSYDTAKAADRREHLVKQMQKKHLIFASDVHSKALELAKISAQEAGVAGLISFSQQCVSKLPHPDLMRPFPSIPVKVVTNPPWDRRLDTDAEASWRQLNAFLRKLNGTAHVLCGEPSLFRLLDAYEGIGRISVKIATIDAEIRSFVTPKIE